MLTRLTPELATAASRDMANKRMRKAGRTKWNKADFNLAAETRARLLRIKPIGGQRAATDHVRNEALSQIYADAAAWLERNSVESSDVAIRRVTDRPPYRMQAEACIVFRANFGCWIGNDEGVLMLCFASAMAATGELGYMRWNSL